MKFELPGLAGFVPDELKKNIRVADTDIPRRGQNPLEHVLVAIGHFNVELIVRRKGLLQLGTNFAAEHARAIGNKDLIV